MLPRRSPRKIPGARRSPASPRILLTGGAGFIGSAVLWALNRAGFDRVVVCDLLGHSDKWKNLAALRFEDYVEASVLFDRLGESGGTPGGAAAGLGSFDFVFHLGAESSTTTTDLPYLMRVNYEFTKRLGAWSLAQGARFVYASSAATYGDGSEGMTDEAEGLERFRPLNPYGWSKHLFDLYANRVGWFDRIVGLKYFNVFGPNEGHKGDMRSVVAKAFEQIRDTGSLRLFRSHRADFEDGEQQRDFLYVKDAAAITVHLAFASSATGLFNVGGGRARTWNDLGRAVFAAMNREPRIDYVDMPESVRSQYQYFTQANIERLRAAGYAQDITPLEDAVSDYVKNYLGPARRLAV
jgi:ADP-L-glycero-D-manno-heptose 6-epimerase